MYNFLRYLIGDDNGRIERFENIEISHKYDRITYEKYYFIKGFNSSLLNNVEKYALNQIMEGTKGPLATLGNDSILKLPNQDLLIFEQTSAQTLRQKLFNDYKEYPFSISFKTAEFHSYMSLKEKSSNKTFEFGKGPKHPTSWQGNAYLRNETMYELKYFRGHQDFEYGSKNLLIDWGSIEITFDLELAQVKSLKKFLQHQHVEMQNNNIGFHLLINNCDMFAQEVFTELFSEGHYAQYLLAEKLDLNDKGIYHLFYSSHSFSTIFINYHKILDIIFNLRADITFNHVINDWYLYLSGKLPFKIPQYFNNTELHIAAYNNDYEFLKNSNIHKYINTQNDFGDSPLNTAVQKGNFEFAKQLLDLQADPNLTNHKGFTALHNVFSIANSNIDKISIVQILLMHGADTHKLDAKGYWTPLFEAAKSNDVALFKLLVGKTDLYYETKEGDNIAHFAVKYNLTKIKDYLAKNHPLLFYAKNIDGFTPKELERALNKCEDSPLFRFENIEFGFESEILDQTYTPPPIYEE